MTVLPGVEAHGTVDPHPAMAVVLEEQLVEVDVLLDEAEVLKAYLLLWQVDVHGLAAEVLGAPYPADALVDLGRPETAVHADRPEHLAQGFAERPTEVDQPRQLQFVGRVVLTVFLGPCRARHLLIAEMRRKHKVLSFHFSFLCQLNTLQRYEILEWNCCRWWPLRAQRGQDTL